jgi:hypothetical protein
VVRQAASEVLVADVSQVYLVTPEALVVEVSAEFSFSSDAKARRRESTTSSNR